MNTAPALAKRELDLTEMRFSNSFMLTSLEAKHPVTICICLTPSDPVLRERHMNTHRLKPVAVAVLVIVIGGCSSVRSRTEMATDDWKVYPGVRRDFSDLDDAFAGKLKGPDWTPAMVGPILVGDIPFSSLVDTAALPYDIYRVENKPDEPSQP
jgi:uncharacterized protein YceK